MGLTEHRCPECGRQFDPDDESTFRTRILSGKLMLFVAIVCALISLVPPSLLLLNDLGLLHLRRIERGWMGAGPGPCAVVLGWCGAVLMVKIGIDALIHYRNEAYDRNSIRAAIVISSLTVIGWVVALILRP